MKAAGYAGEKTVVISPADYPIIGPHGQVTTELLRSLGFNVDLQEMDWSTVPQRRLSKEPADRGGWSVYHTNWPSVSIANLAMNATIWGDGTYPGWYTDAPYRAADGRLADGDGPGQAAGLVRVHPGSRAGPGAVPAARPVLRHDRVPRQRAGRAERVRILGGGSAGCVLAARLLGGGSSINGIGANRGAPGDYDEWASLGADGWSWAGVLPYFRKLERDADYGTGDLRGYA